MTITAATARTTPQTFTVYQRPDLSGNIPQPGAAPRVVMSQDGSSSQKITVYQRPDLSANVQPDQSAGSRQLPARGNYDYNRGHGNQYSPPLTAAQPQQSLSPSQAPVLLPARGYGNYSYSQPANYSAPAYSQPAYSQPASRPAAAQDDNPQPQPVQLPPSHSQSAPAQSSQWSSSQSSASQSSGRR